MADFTTVMSDVVSLDNSLVLAFDQSFIIAAGQDNVMDQFVQYKKEIGGKSISLTKYARLSLATTPLTEKSDLVSEAMTDSEILFTPVEYGNVVTTTALASLQSGGKVNLAAAENIGKNVGTTLDKLAILALDASTNVRIVGNTAEGSVTAGQVISGTELNIMYNKLARMNIPTFNGSYVLVAHDDVIADLRADTSLGSWVDVAKYSTPETVLKNEVGMYKGFRVVRDNNATFVDQTGAGTVDIYNSYCFGNNALGRVDSLPPGMVITQTDKLNRFLNVGWKATLKFGIVDQDAIWTLRTSSSLGANSV
jgi:N4-gp56 family major capsid protein